EWLSADPARPIPRRLDLILFAAAWTRYEAWLVIAAALALAATVRWRRGEPAAAILAKTVRLALWPAVAVLIFLLDSRVTVGSWFVSSGFFVPDPTYQGLVARSALAIWWGTHRMSGYVIEAIA